MDTANVFAQLFTAVSKRLFQHPSDIAQVIATELRKSTHLPIVKTPQILSQCEALNSTLEKLEDDVSLQLRDVQKHLHWSDSSGGIKPEDVRHLLAFVELLGPTGMVENAHCRTGLYLQMQDTNYPAHRHAAEELYMILSGNGTWFRDSEPNGKLQIPGDIIIHKSFEPHAMVSTAEPLLALWCWTGDIDFTTYEML